MNDIESFEEILVDFTVKYIGPTLDSGDLHMQLEDRFNNANILAVRNQANTQMEIARSDIHDK